MDKTSATPSSQTRDVNNSEFTVLHDPETCNVDIVFVHGFTGDPEKTWTAKTAKNIYASEDQAESNTSTRPRKLQKLLASGFTHSKTGVYWPKDLLPKSVPNARILTYGYDTHIRHVFDTPVNKTAVYSLAHNFLVALDAQRRDSASKSRPLIFIAHSLGGIIVKEALSQAYGSDNHQLRQRNIFDCTIGIIFFGTPHSGSDPQSLARFLVESFATVFGFKINTQIVNTLLPSSDLLMKLRNTFGGYARDRKWVIYCFQEQDGLKVLNGGKVVDDISSCFDDPSIETTQYIANNHMDMCRFSRKDDVQYQKVIAALEVISRNFCSMRASSVQHLLSPEQRRGYMDSLKFGQMNARYQSIKAAQASTCTWVVQKPEYKGWLDDNRMEDHHGFLWIKGKPATGKSTIMKFACEYTKKELRSIIILTFFFNARGEDIEKSVAGMYRCLLYQLLEAIPELQSVLDVLGEFHEPEEMHTFKWDADRIRPLFEQAVKRLGNRRLICFIDALDECKEDDVREMVEYFEELGRTAIASKINLRVCFSSRHYPHITIEKRVEFVLEEQEGHKQDIIYYINKKLRCRRSKKIDTIKDKILNRASGIFLWVILVVQILNKECDHGRLKTLEKRLEDIPTGLNELFKDILSRDNQNVEEMILCLRWVLCSRQKLDTKELYFGLHAGIEDSEIDLWDPDDINDDDLERYILSSSKGLVEVTRTKDKRVQFIHESVREFLLKENVLEKLKPGLGGNFVGTSHEQLKRCCFRYMRVENWKRLDWFIEYMAVVESKIEGSITKREERLKSAAITKIISELCDGAKKMCPFLEYSVNNVLHHAEAAAKFGIPQKDFIREFPTLEYIHTSNFMERFEIRRHTPSCSLLYILAEQNLPRLIRIELGNVEHMDINGERYGLPTHVAIARKAEESLSALLMPREMDYDEDGDIIGSTSVDRKTAVQNLFEMDDKDLKGRSLIEWSSANHDLLLTKILIMTRKSDFNIPNISSRKCKLDTEFPICKFASNGHTELVEMLLSSVGFEEIDLELFRYPFQAAAENGHLRIIQLLLARKQIKDVIITSNWVLYTTLNAAVKRRQHETVSYLITNVSAAVIANKIKPWSLLKQATVGNDEKMVDILLKQLDIDINYKDLDGLTILSLAISKGHTNIVKLLLAQNDIAPDIPDNENQTPLLMAAALGYVDVVELLLDRDDVKVNHQSNGGGTALSCAVSNRHVATIKTLLARDGIAAGKADSHGDTPLLKAVRRAYGDANLEIVRLLLERDDVNINKSSLTDSRTALSIAAEYGNSDIVRLLLYREEIDVNSKKNDDWTPLAYASYAGKTDVVELLLEHPKVISAIDSRLAPPNDRLLAAPEYQISAIFLAAKKGYTDIVRLLVDVKVNFERTYTDENGRTPISYAAESGHVGTLLYLLERFGAEENSLMTLENLHGSKTPLYYALHSSVNGREKLVEILSSRHDAYTPRWGPVELAADFLRIKEEHIYFMSLVDFGLSACVPSVLQGGIRNNLHLNGNFNGSDVTKIRTWANKYEHTNIIELLDQYVSITNSTEMGTDVVVIDD